MEGIVIFMIIGIILLILITFSEDSTLNIIPFIIVLVIILVLGIELINKYKEQKEIIPAIEVYRGNTELQISYIDSIPQDSIVVLKKRN